MRASRLIVELDYVGVMEISRDRGLLIGLGCGAVYAAAIVALVVTGNTALRYSADHHDTRSLLTVCLPAAAGIALAWAIRPGRQPADPFAAVPRARITRQAWFLAALAVAFAVAVHLLPGDGWFVLLKLALLAIPLIAGWATLREWARVDTRGHWLRPLPAVLAFVAVSTVLQPSSGGSAIDPITIVVVFVLNAVIEEVFYRFWLQSRLESRYGMWPAIALSSLLWAAWHTAIQGGLGFPLDFAAVVANQGVTGLFLGYLWARHRNPWLVIAVHGLINAPLTMFLG